MTPDMEDRGSTAMRVWGFGSMLAITISWSLHRSILRMIVHGILSWIYVICYAIKRQAIQPLLYGTAADG